jgi:hypothetical protein
VTELDSLFEVTDVFVIAGDGALLDAAAAAGMAVAALPSSNR